MKSFNFISDTYLLWQNVCCEKGPSLQSLHRIHAVKVMCILWRSRNNSPLPIVSFFAVALSQSACLHVCTLIYGWIWPVTHTVSAARWADFSYLRCLHFVKYSMHLLASACICLHMLFKKCFNWQLSFRVLNLSRLCQQFMFITVSVPFITQTVIFYVIYFFPFCHFITQQPLEASCSEWDVFKSLKTLYKDKSLLPKWRECLNVTQKQPKYCCQKQVL